MPAYLSDVHRLPTSLVKARVRCGKCVGARSQPMVPGGGDESDVSGMLGFLTWESGIF